MIAPEKNSSNINHKLHYVARQPILDRAGNTFGYELLYRQDQPENILDNDGDRATMRVIQSLFAGNDFGDILSDRLGFINCTRYIIKSGLYEILPKERFVLEILESIDCDDSFINSCREAKKKGYRIALDDYRLKSDSLPILELADYVKVDFLEETESTIEELALGKDKFGYSLIAEKVEDELAFKVGTRFGYDYFQGYYFCRPESSSSQTVTGFRTTEIHLLAEISKPHFDVNAVAKIIKNDPVFSYRLLKYINSSYFGFAAKVGSIKQAVVLLGSRKIRHWATASVLAMATISRPPELLRMLLVRAHFLQHLAEKIRLPEEECDELYLIGVFSLLHIALGIQLNDLLQEVPIKYEIKNTITGGVTKYSDYLSIIKHLERGEWANIDRFGLPPDLIATSYQEALLCEFAQEI